MSKNAFILTLYLKDGQDVEFQVENVPFHSQGRITGMSVASRHCALTSQPAHSSIIRGCVLCSTQSFRGVYRFLCVMASEVTVDKDERTSMEEAH